MVWTVRDGHGDGHGDGCGGGVVVRREMDGCMYYTPHQTPPPSPPQQQQEKPRMKMAWQNARGQKVKQVRGEVVKKLCKINLGADRGGQLSCRHSPHCLTDDWRSLACIHID